MHRRFGGAVVGASRQRDDSQTAGDEDQSGLVLLGEQEWQEGRDQMNVGEVIRRELQIDIGEVDGGWIGEIDTPLDAGVQHDAVQIRMVLGDASGCVSLSIPLESQNRQARGNTDSWANDGIWSS